PPPFITKPPPNPPPSITNPFLTTINPCPTTSLFHVNVEHLHIPFQPSIHFAQTQYNIYFKIILNNSKSLFDLICILNKNYQTFKNLLLFLATKTLVTKNLFLAIKKILVVTYQLLPTKRNLVAKYLVHMIVGVSHYPWPVHSWNVSHFSLSRHSITRSKLSLACASPAESSSSLTNATSMVILSAVIASVVSEIGLGSEPAITVPEYDFRSPSELPLYLLLGVLCGLVSLILSRCTSFMLVTVDNVHKIIGIPKGIFPILGGLAVGLIALAYREILYWGFENVDIMLESRPSVKGLSADLLFQLVAVKIVATSVCRVSGLVGGYYAPSLFIGAATGMAYGKFVSSTISLSDPIFHLSFLEVASPQAYGLVGMAATLAGVCQVPLTAVLLLFELTQDYRRVLPLLEAVGLSSWITSGHTSRTERDTKKLEEGNAYPTIQPKMSSCNLNELSAKTTLFYSCRGSNPITILHKIKKNKKKKQPSQKQINHNPQPLQPKPALFFRLFSCSLLLAFVLGVPCRCCLRVSHAAEHVHFPLLLNRHIWRPSKSEHHGEINPVINSISPQKILPQKNQDLSKIRCSKEHTSSTRTPLEILNFEIIFSNLP
ncbi:Chloride channel protein CLC-e, partial [Camellia lanceoleosa]